MSQRWEEAVQRWYEESVTANLEYLDLAETVKPKNSQLAHNIAVVYDRVVLAGKVNITQYKRTQEALQRLDNRCSDLEKSMKQLTKLFRENKPLSKEEAKALIKKISERPKRIEAQALELTEKLSERLERVEKLLHKIEEWNHS